MLNVFVYLTIFCFYEKNGKGELDKFLDINSDCVSKTFDNINCDELDDELKIRTAVKLYNCHAPVFGLSVSNCEHSKNIKSCLSRLSKDDSKSILNWVIHIEPLCHEKKNENFVSRFMTSVTSLSDIAYASLKNFSDINSNIDVLNKKVLQWEKMQQDFLDVYLYVF